MTRSERLNPVFRLASDKEQAAAKEFGTSQAQWQQKRDRLSELEQYREEYRRKLHEATAAGIDAGTLREYRAFLVRLDKAIDQQTRVVGAASQEVERKRQGWIDHRAHSKSIGNLIDKCRDAESQAEARREQKESDERAQHQTLGKKQP